MYRLGHTGIALLVLAPLCFVLLEAHNPLLAFVSVLGVVGIEPLPDLDFRLPVLSHRGVSHSLLAAIIIGGLLGLCGWVATGQVAPTLASGFTAVGEAARTGATSLQSLTPSGATGRIAHLLRALADSLGGIGTQLRGLDRQMVAGYGFAIGAGGILVHLLGDVITVSGIRPLLPFSSWRLSLSSLRAKSTVANTGLFAGGVVAIAVVLSLTVGGAALAGMPADLSPIGAASAQDASSNMHNGSVQINTTASNRTQIELDTVSLPQNGYIVARSGNLSANTPAQGTVLGHTQYVRHGNFSDVVLDLNRSVNTPQTVSVTIHNDTNGNRSWDGARTDSAYNTSSETPVLDIIRFGSNQNAATGSQNTSNTTATVEFANQTVNGSTVTIERATLPEGGFVVLSNDPYEEVGVLRESMIAVSQPLSPGTHRNITLNVTSSPPGGVVNQTTFNTTSDYSVGLYRDTNNNSRFEYITSAGTNDTAYLTGTGTERRFVSDVADVAVPGSNTPPPNASIRFRDQSTNGASVTVDSVTLPRGGFVVVHNQSYLRGGDPTQTAIGISGYLPAGTHRNVSVTLTNGSLQHEQTLIAIPSQDTNNSQTYDYVQSDGFQDVPYTAGGEVVTARANVSISENEGSPPTAVTSTAPSTDSPRPATAEAAGSEDGNGGWFSANPLTIGIGIVAALLIIGVVALSRRS